MHLDPQLPLLVALIFLILLTGLFLKIIKQPYVIGYLIAGVVIGPSGFGFIKNDELITRLGAIGVILLLFFIGMETSPRRLIENWKIAILGTLLQILISIGCIWLLGTFFDWSFERIILIGFVISLSSTAVVLKLLQDWKELESRSGQNALSILLMQDLAVIPMLIVLSFIGGENSENTNPLLQIFGALLITAIIVKIVMSEQFKIPYSNHIKNDREMQVFFALLICMGFSVISGLLGLSTALGAFAAGLIIGAAKETVWVHNSLEPFRIVFITLFFVSIGMLLDLKFLTAHITQISVLVILILFTNTFINAIILRVLGETWQNSIYSGTLLSQIGEFSFVLAAAGKSMNIIGTYGYLITVSIIAVSLLVSPFWIALIKRILIKYN